MSRWPGVRRRTKATRPSADTSTTTARRVGKLPRTGVPSVSTGPCQVGGLDNDTSYTFNVRAVNTRGGGEARIQATPAAPEVALPRVSVSPVEAAVTEGTDVQFRFARTGSTSKSLELFVDLTGHRKIMSTRTRPQAGSSGSGEDIRVTFETGESEATVTLTTEADRVNEGDGEISVAIVASPKFEIRRADARRLWSGTTTFPRSRCAGSRRP